ncbi:MAG: hypothetical protein ACOYOK_00680 [Pseudobdellovibrionaceae bacterium]
MQKKSQKILGILFFIFSIFFFLLMFNSEDNEPTVNLKNRKIERQLVEKNLQNTAKKIEILEQKASNENYFSELQKKQPQQEYTNSHNGVNLDIQQNSKETVDLIRKKNALQDSPTPQNMIQTELFRAQKFNEYDEAYREAYAQQFLQNAKSAGWNIKLDDNYKVIEVKPLPARQPGSESQKSEKVQLQDGSAQ